MGKSYAIPYLVSYVYEPFWETLRKGFNVNPLVKVNRLIISYQLSEFGYMALTIHHGP